MNIKDYDRERPRSCIDLIAQYIYAKQKARCNGVQTSCFLAEIRDGVDSKNTMHATLTKGLSSGQEFSIQKILYYELVQLTCYHLIVMKGMLTAIPSISYGSTTNKNTLSH